MGLSASEIFADKIANKLKEKGDKVCQINAVYEFKIAGPNESTWTLDCTKAGGEVKEGSSGSAQCTVSISLQDLSDIIEQKLNPQMAFMSGKLKVTGDMGLALKLGNIL